jgi:hypothetical protein
MAEENKTQFKAVEVSMDDEGNQVITPVEKPEVEETTDEVEETTEETTEETSAEEVEQAQEEVEEVEQAQEEVEETEEEESQEEIEETEEVHTNDEEVVDYDELPESVQGYLDFLEETGGSMQDFLAANRDFTKMPQDEAIRAHLKATNPYLDDEDREPFRNR